MSVYRPAKSKHYHYDFVFKGQRYCGSTGCVSKTEARDYETRERRRIANGTEAKPEITLSEACALWADEKGQHQKNWNTCKGQIKTLLKIVGGPKLLSDLRIAEFRQFVARRRAHITKRKAPLAPASINREVELARRVWRHAADTYAVSAIEWRKVVLAEPKERVRELSAAEEARLWAAAPNPEIRAVVEFAMLSGQRRTSIITMLWSKVDFEARKAEVRVKGGGWHEFPLTPRLVAIIANQPKIAPQVFTYICERPSPPRQDRPRRLKGERYPFSKQGWYRRWYAWLEAAGIENFRFHDLRHTALSRVVRASGNLKVGQKLAGHSDIATTARYAHVLENDIRDAMISAESRIIPGPPSADDAEKPAGSTLRRVM